MRAVYPGSFNPPTIGHVAIVEAALGSHALSQIDLMISRRALAKDVVDHPSLDHRVDVVRASFSHLPEVDVRTTDLQLIADIAESYDLVIMGADKWAQINDITFYDSSDHRANCLQRLPKLAIASRGDQPVPPDARLIVPDHIAPVSSTAARGGHLPWMTKAAQAAGYWH